ncbi:MAG: RNA methyltransferase [Bacteroidetes bacterium]|nr:RNA methyltransferase [Bacteroidota bacterium]
MAQQNREERLADAEAAMRSLLRTRHGIDVSRGLVRVESREYGPDCIERTLEPVVGPDRRERIDAVLDGRSYSVATVVEGLANVGNASAVMRTAEAFGFQPFHVITGSTPLKRSGRTTQGADKWLDVSVWGTPDECVAALRNAGYRVLATCLDDDAVPLDQADFSGRVAIVLGNELAGISDTMRNLADGLIRIEMPGFVESFNISVAAAITLYHAHLVRKQTNGAVGDLSPDERRLLRASFLARSTRHAADLLERACSGSSRDSVG